MPGQQVSIFGIAQEMDNKKHLRDTEVIREDRWR